MTDHQAAIASGFYDHEMDSALENERPAPDWGADEVFATTPRRRFRKSRGRAQQPDSWLTRTDEQALERIRREATERRSGHPRATSRRAIGERESPAGREATAWGATGAAEQPRTAVAPDRAELESGERAATAASVRAATDAAEPDATEGADRAATAAAERAAIDVMERATAEAVERGVDVEFTGMRAEHAGRRTVVVTGRPAGESHPRPLRTERRRPPRTVADHVGGRPDRIAAWAFGLGLTLILIAVTTADAAPL